MLRDDSLQKKYGESVNLNTNINLFIVRYNGMYKLAVLAISILLLGSPIAFVGTASGCTRADFENVIESARQTIYILPDGSVDPASAPIQQDENTYTFTEDIYASIVIDKENIVIDGGGYTLLGPFNGTQTDLWIIGESDSNQTENSGNQVPWTVGIDLLANTHEVTVRNLNIKNFTIGVWLWTANNTITNNALSENLLGILLSGIDNVITENIFSNNRDAIFFGANQPGDIPTNITLSANSFIDNARHLSGCICVEFDNNESMHTWDNGDKGNFWSDYTGIDANGDGLGDTPYVIDVLNHDRYPLIQSVALAPTVVPKFPVEIVALAVVLSIITLLAFAKRTKNRSSQ